MEIEEFFRKNAAPYIQRITKEITGSEALIAIASSNYFRNAMCAMQLGLAIMHNKPIVLIVPKNTNLPTKLVKFADSIQYVDSPDDVTIAAERGLKEVFKDE